MNKPKKPRGIGYRPTKPFKPQKVHKNKMGTTVHSLRLSEYTIINDDLIELLKEYPLDTHTYRFDCDAEHGYYDSIEVTASIEVSGGPTEIPNPNYDVEIEQYNIAYKKYRADLTLWNKYEKELAVWVAERNEEAERKVYEKLKKKFND